MHYLGPSVSDRWSSPSEKLSASVIILRGAEACYDRGIKVYLFLAETVYICFRSTNACYDRDIKVYFFWLNWFEPSPSEELSVSVIIP